MMYPSIRVEGAILSSDLIERLDDLPGQRPADFGLETGSKVKDEIARAWADAQDYWRIFHRKLETLRPESPATTETRNLWIVPLLGLLKYDLEYQKAGAELNGKTYAISHRVTNRGHTPLHIVGYRDPAGLDRKPANATLRMSAHAVVQEYLNLSEELYGLVTNGRTIRLLRDSSRLIKLTFVEFDLDRIFTDGLFADFAVLYRLLHSSRLPQSSSAAAESLIERYHQDSLDSGARIREGLSRAVEEAIRTSANGFLSHPANTELRARLANDSLDPDAFYKSLLRLIYRLLFLMVIEERGLVFPPDAKPSQRQTYERYYSVLRLRRLAEKRYLADGRHDDLWLALVSTFRLFDATGPGPKLGLKPLAGDLFGYGAIGDLESAQLSNANLLRCLRSLSLYTNPINGQILRVNYGALNVEEFGSVYEGLLEYEPAIDMSGNIPVFDFRPGDERSATGSHYTPDDLVQPLIKHSLDHLIAERLKSKDPAAALLDLRVADIACGSGHILLAAARRIGTELAIVRTGEEQPSPSALRSAVRDVIRNCIYGVDLNPLAVDLCKVALWLEAHNPGEPLNFLDHHIKCGNAIVGFVKREEVDAGVPNEAFAKLPGDDPDVGKEIRARNKRERKERATGQAILTFTQQRETDLAAVLERWRVVTSMPDNTPEEIEAKKSAFDAFSSSGAAFTLRNLASIPIAQFYIPRTKDNMERLVTDEPFRGYWSGRNVAQGQATAAAIAVGHRKRFFHWFLEFPAIIHRGGFDCILGNPPYLGSKKLAMKYGFDFAQLLRALFPSVSGNCDLVASFVIRGHALLARDGYLAFLTTKTVCQGDTRKSGLGFVTERGAQVQFAVSSTRWPGRAAVDVSLFAISQRLRSAPSLNGRSVSSINSYFESDAAERSPKPLKQWAGIAFKGSEPAKGFMLSLNDAAKLITDDECSRKVIKPYLVNDDFSSHPLQMASRCVIDFGHMPIAEASAFEGAFSHVKARVCPAWEASGDQSQSANWWWHRRRAEPLYAGLNGLPHGFAVGYTTKHGAFAKVWPGTVFANLMVVICAADWSTFAQLSSTLHGVWAWRYGSSMGSSTLRYTPSSVFETYPFLSPRNSTLGELGESLYLHRKRLLTSLWIGLTEIYNLVHDRACEAGLQKLFAARVKRSLDRLDIAPDHRDQVLAFTYDEALAGLLELRRLHVELDNAVRDAYGWVDLDLEHDFHEVETLPENDRVRYTISPAGRREVLTRLLALNHERAAAEASAAKASRPNPKASKRKTPKKGEEVGLFTPAGTTPPQPVAVPFVEAMELLVAILDELHPAKVQRLAAERMLVLAISSKARERYRSSENQSPASKSPAGNIFRALWQTVSTTGFATISDAGTVSRTDKSMAFTNADYAARGREAVKLFKEGEKLKRAWPIGVDDVQLVS